MAIQDKNTLKTYFETGDAPSQNQFADLIDSLKHENYTLSKQEIVVMANQLSSIDNGFILYDAENIEDSIVRLEVTQQNAENQIIKINDTADGQIKQYFIGDAPYSISMKEFESEKLSPTEYYYFYWQLNQNYAMQRLFGNNLPDIPKGFEFGMLESKRFYFQISKRDYGQEMDIVNANIKFVNKTDIAIGYRTEAGNWSDMYRKEDTITEHYNSWDYLYFYYNADMTNVMETIVCNIYNNDTKELVASNYLTSGKNNQNAWGGSVDKPRNILIECIKNRK